MREEYDFSNSVQNPYAKHVKKQISIRIETDTINYFKDLAKETGITYQNLINSYLTECAHKHVKPELKWALTSTRDCEKTQPHTLNDF